MSANDAQSALSNFRADFGLFSVVEINAALISQAMAVAERRALRAYDSVQLAAALNVRRRRAAKELSEPELISADVALNDVALLEGLKVDDPNNH